MSDKGRKRATSTLVTRALGDAHGSESLSASPEIIQVQNVKPGSRIIIGSDGLWDVFTNEKAIAFIKSIRDPRRAAAKLAKEAYNLRLYGGLSKDDITVFVVNVEQPIDSSAHGLNSLRAQVSMTEDSASPAVDPFFGNTAASFDYTLGSFVVESIDTPTLSKWKLRAKSFEESPQTSIIQEEDKNGDDDGGSSAG